MGIEYTNKITATLVDSMGTEQSIVDAARVSLARPYRVQKRWFSLFRKVIPTEAYKAPHNPARLIARLYKEKHGVPFEHCEMVFHFEMPIFVSRQLSSIASARSMKFQGVTSSSAPSSTYPPSVPDWDSLERQWTITDRYSRLYEHTEVGLLPRRSTGWLGPLTVA